MNSEQREILLSALEEAMEKVWDAGTKLPPADRIPLTDAQISNLHRLRDTIHAMKAMAVEPERQILGSVLTWLNWKCQDHGTRLSDSPNERMLPEYHEGEA